MKTIDAQGVNKIVEQKDQGVILDVLPEEHFRKEHIPGAKSAPLDSEGFLSRVEQLAGDKSQRVVVYCANSSCDLSPKAAKRLEAEGYKNVVDFDGGIEEWKRSGLPVTNGA
jgi:rhodanese-related sulfurtransferase